jgi:hypothetical protein
MCFVSIVVASVKPSRMNASAGTSAVAQMVDAITTSSNEYALAAGRRRIVRESPNNPSKRSFRPVRVNENGGEKETD